MTSTMNTILQLAQQFERELPEVPAQTWLDGQPVTSTIDHTLLKPEATSAQIETLCKEALQYQFAAVCVNPIFVSQASATLRGSSVKVATVVGFPLGAVPTATKVFETREAVKQGASEIDMVISIGRLKGGEYQAVLDDIRAVVEAAHEGGAIVKVILEMVLLEQREKIIGCLLSKEAGAEFVKTSTGFSSGGATLEDVDLMRRVVGPKMGVKAAGGVRSLEDAREMLQAGANRLGTSAGAKIALGLSAESSY